MLRSFDVDEVIEAMGSVDIAEGDEYAMLERASRVVFDDPNLREVLMEARRRYKRYIEKIDFSPNFHHIEGKIQHFLTIPVRLMSRRRELFYLMKEIDGALLQILNSGSS